MNAPVLLLLHDDSLFFQQVSYGFARLGTDFEPVLDPFALDGEALIGCLRLRVVPAEFFQHLAVAWPVSIDRTYPEETPMPPAKPF